VALSAELSVEVFAGWKPSRDGWARRRDVADTHRRRDTREQGPNPQTAIGHHASPK
jgi:hypothetical protein